MRLFESKNSLDKIFSIFVNNEISKARFDFLISVIKIFHIYLLGSKLMFVLMNSFKLMYSVIKITISFITRSIAWKHLSLNGRGIWRSNLMISTTKHILWCCFCWYCRLILNLLDVDMHGSRYLFYPLERQTLTTSTHRCYILL